MSKLTLAIDVDEPLVSTGKAWINYLKSHYRLKEEYLFTLPEVLPYDLTKLFIIPDEDNERYIGDGFEFFNNFMLYDNLPPREDALEYLPILCKIYDVVFVSKIMGNHFLSKSKWLDKYFPNHKGFYGVSSTKKHVQCDIFVDDCYRNLNDMSEHNPETYCIKFRNDYKEDCDPDMKYKIVYNWEQVYNLLGDM